MNILISKQKAEKLTYRLQALSKREMNLFPYHFRSTLLEMKIEKQFFYFLDISARKISQKRNLMRRQKQDEKINHRNCIIVF